MRLSPSTAVRLAVCVALCVLLHGQMHFRAHMPRGDPTVFDDLPADNFTVEDFNRTLPLDQGDYKSKDATDAAAFFHLPTWAPAYRTCEEHPEISCFELVRAFKVVWSYINSYTGSGLNGYVKVNISTGDPLHCRMSSFYNAFLIALFTKRRLIFSTDEDNSLWLRPEHRSRFTIPVELRKRTGTVIANNFTFACEELMSYDEVIEISGCMWPQIAYIHQDLGRLMRPTFGLHAMYYLGNYLFNVDADHGDCRSIEKNVTAVVLFEGKWRVDQAAMRKKMDECISDKKDKLMFAMDREGQKVSDSLCMMKRIMYGNRIVYPFGAVLPWFAMAMQGVKGGAVSVYKGGCIEFRNSQCGSITHTYNSKKWFHYTTNNDFLVCGPNYNDVRLFMRYMLW